MAKEVADVRGTTVFTDYVEPMLERKTRYDYLMNLLVVWKELIRRKTYMYCLLVAGFVSLFYYPVLAGLAFFGAAYNWQRVKHLTTRIQSKRHVIWGH